MMETKKFKDEVKIVYERILDAFENFDPDDVEADSNLDNISLTFRNGIKFIINQQTPVQQIWLATKKEGLHFVFDENTNSWIGDKTGNEFFEVLSKNIAEQIGSNISI